VRPGRDWQKTLKRAKGKGNKKRTRPLSINVAEKLDKKKKRNKGEMKSNKTLALSWRRDKRSDKICN